MKSIFLASALLGLRATAAPADNVKPRGFDKMAATSNSELVERISFSTTMNELGECAPITVIFARGTVEPGNVGDLAGPPFFNALDVLYGDSNVAVQGVDYPATVAGYLEGGDPGGAATLAALTNQAASQCPDTQIVLSGYSQGAQVVHLGVKQISALVSSRVNAVVFFGDPDHGQALENISPSIVDSFCFKDDLICHGLPVVDTFHLSYSVDATAAALFVQAHVSI
ncbi:MAG: carbohydrate esterase family 5 [Lasallia pustulata]|uniref:Cutinase n=1 Tax=Lasallia pustulata TaxID=136370 RepID=A0A5M8PFI6_9LECA|nr:MAG: carbohydrate esterase family 5 [Lasallia pustulata]